MLFGLSCCSGKCLSENNESMSYTVTNVLITQQSCNKPLSINNNYYQTLSKNSGLFFVCLISSTTVVFHGFVLVKPSKYITNILYFHTKYDFSYKQFSMI